MLTLRRLRRDELHKFQAFLRKEYGPNHYGADERYSQWLYLDCPCPWFAPEAQAGLAPINVLVDQADTVLAVHAFVPFQVHTPWNGVRGIWDIEWINGSGVRGSGRQMAEALLKEVDVYVGFGCNDLSEAAFGRLGMVVVPEIHRCVVVLDAEGLAAEIEQAGGVSPILTEAKADAEWIVLDKAADIDLPALAAYAARTPFGVSRDRDWLAWRYDHHPYLRYTTIAAGGGGAVIRIEQLVGRDALVCRVLEFFPIDEAGSESLAAAVTSYALARKCLFLDFFSSSDEHVRLLEQGLAAAGRPFSRNLRIPYMTQPFQFGPRDSINMVIAIGGYSMVDKEGIDLAGFHSGKGDANQDVLRRR